MLCNSWCSNENLQSQIRRWPKQQSLITSSYNKLPAPTQNIFLSVFFFFKLNCINLFYSCKNVLTIRTCICTINLRHNKLDFVCYRWFEGGYLFCFVYLNHTFTSIYLYYRLVSTPSYEKKILQFWRSIVPTLNTKVANASCCNMLQAQKVQFISTSSHSFSFSLFSDTFLLVFAVCF